MGQSLAVLYPLKWMAAAFGRNSRSYVRIAGYFMKSVFQRVAQFLLFHQMHINSQSNG